VRQDAEPVFFNNAESEGQMGKTFQKVASDRSQIPEHFVKLASFGCHTSGRPATPQYKALFAAWGRNELSGYKLMTTPNDTHGAIWIDPHEAQDILIAAGLSGLVGTSEEGGQVIASRHRADQIMPEPAITALCEINNGITLMQATLERLTVAVKSIAKQPRTSQQELMHTFSTNGFDS
jgi:hypothetical protein